jgi:hypothetical protein
MSELELIAIRIREHRLAMLDLLVQLKRRRGDDEDDLWQQIRMYGEEKDIHIKELESQGHDYLTITAEMARIRAEVRGEK